MSIKFQTDQTGANNNVCSSTSQIFNFSLSTSNTVSSATFDIKKGSGTTASITVSIYNQPNGSGSVVESVTVLASSITQTFAPIAFNFTGSTTLSADTSYSLVVSSTTSCTGNNPYSMKSGNFQLIDTGSGSVINTGYGISCGILCDATITSSSNIACTITSNISSINTVSSNTLINNNISTNINILTLIEAQAIKVGNNRKIKLDGSNILVKIYLGNQKRKIYHANRLIIDNT